MTVISEILELKLYYPESVLGQNPFFSFMPQLIVKSRLLFCKERKIFSVVIGICISILGFIKCLIFRVFKIIHLVAHIFCLTTEMIYLS